MSDNDKGKRKHFFANNSGYKKRKNFILEPDLKGFICTCNFKERETVREAYNLLNKYADQMYGEEHPVANDGSDKEDNIEDSLANELKQLKSNNEQHRFKRFQVVESGTKNCVFIRTTIEDPVKLACTIIDDIALSGKQQTRFLLRLIPIEITCKAKIEDLKIAFEPLLEKYFGGEPKTFSIVLNRRNNNKFPKDDFIVQIAEMVHKKNEAHKVNLTEAEISIVLEVIRGHACLAVVPNYLKYKKYNLELVCGAQETDTDTKDENKPEGSQEGEEDTQKEEKEDIIEAKDEAETEDVEKIDK